jgi:hypothetical protein
MNGQYWFRLKLNAWGVEAHHRDAEGAEGAQRKASLCAISVLLCYSVVNLTLPSLIFIFNHNPNYFSSYSGIENSRRT